MEFFYLIEIFLILITFFIKDNQRKFIFYPLIVVLIITLSLRASPDEYSRYMLLSANNANQIFEGFPFSETIFRFIAFFSLKTPFPRFSIYFITYFLTFLSILKGLELYKLGLLSKILPICFFLSHQFLSLGYIAIRPGLANAITFWAISYLFTKNNFRGFLSLGIFGFFVHVQSFILLIIALCVYYSKGFALFKNRNILLAILLFLGSVFYYLRTNIEQFLIIIIGRFDYLFLTYMDYFKSDSYGYDISLFDSNILLAIALQFTVYVLYVLFNNNKNTAYSNCLKMILVYPVIIIFFSNISFFALRFASGLALFNLPIIGGFSSQIKSSFKNKKISFSLIVILSLSILLTFYNISITQRLSDFSFTKIDYFLPKK